MLYQMPNSGQLTRLCCVSSVTKGFSLERVQVNLKAKFQILLILKDCELVGDFKKKKIFLKLFKEPWKGDFVKHMILSIFLFVLHSVCRAKI